jgi:hypothetical protein
MEVAKKISIDIGSIMLVIEIKPINGRVIIVPTFLTTHFTSVGVILPVIDYVING